MQDSHSSLYCTKTWYQLYISDPFGSLQKMLTALFNLIWNAQRSKWTVFFECQGKIFLSIEEVLEKISEDQP